MNNMISTVQVFLKDNLLDAKAASAKNQAMKYLGIDLGKVKYGKLFAIDYSLSDSEVEMFALEGLSDKIMHNVLINKPIQLEDYNSCIMIAKLPGVTDDEGTSAQNTLVDIFNTEVELKRQHIFSQDIYFIQNTLDVEQLTQIAEEFLGNKLINKFITGTYDTPPKLYVPAVSIKTDLTVETIPIDISDAELQRISDERHLALTLEELRAIKNFYLDDATKADRLKAGMPIIPTDCEIEIFAQTWSEHCKHKEFNADITYTDLDTGKTRNISSLFKTYIRNATENVQEQLEARNDNWLVKVFTDNAGAVRIDEDNLFVWKVETHNSPSAIDPYGGAITGILGNNRDPMGTGIGGAKLLFNTNVLCFGNPNYKGALLPGQLHPARIFEGVRKGIEDGGNKSGVPTVNGSIIFDDRYAGKPLVYCGTGGILPSSYRGVNSWDKVIDKGDIIVMAGGRIGKDGIHGATFSSRGMDETSPSTAVQIGSPITQKLVADYMEIACREGIIKCSTDCGAGGLSSAIGELASISNGAVVNLEQAPLKYSGLLPWEIFISESQERMILVISPDKLEGACSLAKKMDVEISNIGSFTDDGMLRVYYEGACSAYLPLEFLHEGVPKLKLDAEWKSPNYIKLQEVSSNNIGSTVKKLLGSFNICSRENVIRQYDHEVKGKSIIKPLMGNSRCAPQDAAVMRFNLDSFEGVAISNGIMPKFVELNPYASAAGAFDEAMRSIIAVGGKLPLTEPGRGLFWSVNDNFCVPNSVYNEKTNPDGKRKLAQLVQMCEALYNSSVFYGIPMTSGKDSMKNDYISGTTKISVPPTVLFSMAAKIPDVRKTLTSDFKTAGSLIYLVGQTYSELGGTDYLKLTSVEGGTAPIVRKEEALKTYTSMMHAIENNLLLSAHDVSDGGLLIAAIESCFGSSYGMDIKLDKHGELSIEELLFSESHSRFIVSVTPKNQQAFEALFGGHAYLIGQVTESKSVKVYSGAELIMDENIGELLNCWRTGLENY